MRKNRRVELTEMYEFLTDVIENTCDGDRRTVYKASREKVRKELAELDNRYETWDEFVSKYW